MRLIGMLDSPFVRRVAITLHQLGVDFTHEPVSVFSNFAQFQSINPVVKAPSAVLDDGTVLMDSSLIIAYAESMLPATKSLWSADPAHRRTEFRVVGLALAACEKSAQRVYEQNLRPGEFQFKPWIDRVTGQLLAAYAALDQELLAHPRLFANERSHAAITAAVAWQFTQSLLASVVPASAHPLLCALSGRLERSAAFLKFPPDGPGVQPDSVGSP